MTDFSFWFRSPLLSPHLKQQVNDGCLLAGRSHAEVVHDQNPHEVKDVLLGRVVGQGCLGAHITVFRLAAVHTRVPGEGLELLCGRTCLIIQITDLEWKEWENIWIVLMFFYNYNRRARFYYRYYKLETLHYFLILHISFLLHILYYQLNSMARHSARAIILLNKLSEKNFSSEKNCSVLPFNPETAVVYSDYIAHDFKGDSKEVTFYCPLGENHNMCAADW